MKVVVTGLGVVSPLGVGVARVWERLVAGALGLVAVGDLPNAAEFAGVDVSAVAPVQGFDAAGLDTRRLARFAQYGVTAANEAIAQSGFKAHADPTRVGVCIGSGIGSLADAYDNAVALHTRGARKVSPMFVPRLLTNMAAGAVAIEHGFQGPFHSAATACATGVHALGDGWRMVAAGEADVVVCGAAEAALHPLAVAGFARAKLLATGFACPQEALRPFDQGRRGFVLGEGAGVVVLELQAHAHARGARVLAQLGGYGLLSDGYHITHPSPGGVGAQRAMEAALRLARVDAGEVGYVNAHATLTPLGDAAEAEAIGRLMGQVPVLSTKGATGHLLGAAGAVEAVFTIKAVETGVVPPLLNVDTLDVPLAVVTQATLLRPQHALCNAFGFGGVNAVAVVSRV